MIDILTMFVIASASISVIMAAIKRLVGKETYKHPLFVRLQPLMPLAIGIVFSVLIFSDFSAALRVAAGVLAGACSGHAYKIFKQSIRAEDIRMDNGTDS